ncbi:hypothetical protein [Mycobacterium canetti]|uniref:hypothetical protein n=1 Tax=Mycobacterium canetti TaxID=78331 RepID=UPI00034A1671|nr:hypothetical protein [Mycobacterium canetti]
MNAAANDGPNRIDAFRDERERLLYAELETVRLQRNGLLAELADCRRVVRERDATIELLTAQVEGQTGRACADV